MVKPHLGYVTMLHAKLREKGYSTQRKRDYYFYTNQLEEVKELITDFFKTTPRIVPRGPQKKKASKYPIQIMVKNLLGKTLTLKLNLSDTIDELKTKMQEKDGHQREEHYLQTLGGQRLDENRTLADYNIQAGQTLLEMGRLLGGAREAPTTEDNIESKLNRID